MKRRGPVPFLLLALLAVASAAGCKLEENDPAGGASDLVSSKPGGDMNGLVEEIWEEKVLPYFAEAGTDLATLAPLIASDLDAAGEAHGDRQSNEGSPWQFATRLKGRILTAKTDTRAATADIDIDGDGTADAVLQLGPVIKGTTLRDVLPFFDFTSFKDQIEYAQLSRALNAKAYATATEELPRDDLTGREIEAVGAFSMRQQGDVILVTPVAVTFTDR